LNARTLAEELAGFTAGLRLKPPPDAVLEMAESCLLDTFGVALAGTTTPWARAVEQVVRAEAATGTATLLGDLGTAPVALAALANGTSAHSLDFDDDNALLHAGAAVVPGALAVAEHVGAPGALLLRAVAAGYEVAVRTAWAVRPERLRRRGFHSTGVCNPLGVAAAAGVLLGLDEARMTAALGIAGSMASGLGQFFEDGTMTKRLHAGQAAQSGVHAALLAQAGFTGPRAVFEGGQGYLRAFVGEGDPAALTGDLGTRYLILETAQKYYPVNFACHAAIDGIRNVLATAGIGAADIAGVVARVRPLVAPHAGAANARTPPTVLAAQMSLPFAVAVTLVDGPPTLAHLGEEWIHRADVLREAAKVEVVADPELDRIEGVERGTVLPVALEVTTTTGAVHRKLVAYQRGDPRNPLSREDVETKFLACARRVLDTDTAERTLARLRALGDLSDVREVTRGLTDPPE
jgi:2-methylcitrate dehydratase PrpD